MSDSVHMSGRTIAIFVILGVIVLITGPLYNVWRKELSGKAQLRQAEWNKKVLVEEAKAHKESAKLLAEAEVERAKGVAESNEVIANGLKDNEEYLKYLYITTLKDLNTQLIYVPTEAGLPILEAKR